VVQTRSEGCVNEDVGPGGPGPSLAQGLGSRAGRRSADGGAGCRADAGARPCWPGDTELRSTKSRRAREVPLPDQAAAALDRLSRRGEFVGPDDYVFANRLGRRLDPSALRRRFERARDAAHLEPLRFHDLRHTYGSLLVAGGIDLASVKAAMGHSRIATTERYLHARPAGELADRFTRALGGGAGSPELARAA
jgi:integrase